MASGGEGKERRKGKRVPVACLGVLYHFNRATVNVDSLGTREGAGGLKLQFFASKESAKSACKVRREVVSRARRKLKRGEGKGRGWWNGVQWTQSFAEWAPRLAKGKERQRKAKRVAKRDEKSDQVSSLPLSLAFKLTRKFPTYYEIACDEAERESARKIVQEESGEKEAARLLGARQTSVVPLFSVPGVRVVLKTDKGAVSYKPMFLSSTQLEQAWSIARRILCQSLISKRKSNRKQTVSDVVKAATMVSGLNLPSSSNSGFESDNEENGPESDDLDAMDGMGDPPEIKEFLEELGESNSQGTGSNSSSNFGRMSPLTAFSRVAGSIACSTTALLGQAYCCAGDIADQVLLDYSWGWRALGLNPNVNMEVFTLDRVLNEISAREASSRQPPTSSPSKAIVPYRTPVDELMEEAWGLSSDDPVAGAPPKPFQVPQELLPFQVLDVDPAPDSEKGKTSPADLGFEDSSDDEVENLQGTVECFLDWSKATKPRKPAPSKKPSQGEEEGKQSPSILGGKNDGLLLVGSIGLSSSVASIEDFRGL
ncbi:hypothetical protein A3770_02p12480 [Chloropicon primus]|uniref:Uncharacterized protein n=1 Tax=Chloropicon primus TaxID=1764295 RepID=A0A5B8MH98_9CHLO|nr:hypothetical protein A3770_02p12480 [Chloropicon primus]|eukprot:QDZ18730.1 hypothetical protein A3770_02p12480 [Chloropicon primus]